MASGSDGSKRPRGPCTWCVNAVKWIPVLFIVTIIIWSYYAYVFQLCTVTVKNDVERVLYLIGYHILFAIFMWAYWQTIFTEIGRVPTQFKMPRAELEKLEQAESDEAQRQILQRFAQNLPVTNRTVTGAIRYCEKCQHVKPDRAHHCSVCGECVLKMDHHCPWVNNCVAFTNYKFFILFLGYALLYCLFIAFTTLSYFISFWKGDLQGFGRFHILFLFFVAVMFAVSLVSLFCYHCYLVLKNRSTLEAFRAPIFRTGADKDGFSLGKYNNFQEVFGDNRKKWFLPVFTSLGDGVVYPVRAQHQPSSYNSMGSTQTSLGDGVTFPQRCIDEDTDTLLGTRQRWVEEAELDSPPFSSPHTELSFSLRHSCSYFSIQFNTAPPSNNISSASNLSTSAVDGYSAWSEGEGTSSSLVLQVHSAVDILRRLNALDTDCSAVVCGLEFYSRRPSTYILLGRSWSAAGKLLSD